MEFRKCTKNSKSQGSSGKAPHAQKTLLKQGKKVRKKKKKK